MEARDREREELRQRRAQELADVDSKLAATSISSPAKSEPAKSEPAKSVPAKPEPANSEAPAAAEAAPVPRSTGTVKAAVAAATLAESEKKTPVTARFGAPPTERCPVCEKAVYPVEKVAVDGKTFHKSCFKCAECQRVLTLGTYAAGGNQYYCKVRGRSEEP